MRRITAFTLVAAGLGLALVGCTSEPPQDAETEAAMQQWSSTLEADLPGDVTTIGGAPSYEDAPLTDSTRVDFESPATFERLEFSCFGDGTMSLSVRGDAASGTTSSTIENMQCAKSPHMVEMSMIGTDPLNHLSASGYGSSQQSAWLFVAYPTATG